MQNAKAVGPACKARFNGFGGVGPYSYQVLPGGAGGAIDSVSGVYTGPANVTTNLNGSIDTIMVTDTLTATATAEILVGDAPRLLCDIIQTELELADGQAYLWDQKYTIPKDSALYVAVGILSAKPYSNNIRYDKSAGFKAVQYINMNAILTVDILSRSLQAQDRKEEILFAINSDYARNQMDRNAFQISPISSQFTNISEVDGGAIPYRYSISLRMMYALVRVKDTAYFENFQQVNEWIDK